MTSLPANFIAVPPGQASSVPESKPQNAAEAAKQFEALLIAQMLRSAHESNEGAFGGGDGSSDAMFDVAGQRFAQVLANSGGLGLARMIVQGLQRK